MPFTSMINTILEHESLKELGFFFSIIDLSEVEISCKKKTGESGAQHRRHS